MCYSATIQFSLCCGYVLLKRNYVPQCYYSVQFMLWICSIKEELYATVLLFSSVYVVNMFC